MLRTYLLRAYDDNYEITRDRRHLIALDLDTPSGVLSARVMLEGARAEIARAHKIKPDGDRYDTFRLSVHAHEQDGGGYVMDWCGA
jgi:hypothetical protein